MPFQIDVDAYNKLNAYLDAVKRRFSHIEGNDEIEEDIEARIAEMFQERLQATSRKIVSIRDVDDAIKIMGTPEEFDQFEAENDAYSDTNNQRSTYKVGKKLYRDPDDKVFGGVISGITKYFGFENPTWARIIVAALPILDFFGTLGISTSLLILTYIILWIVIPVAKTPLQKMQMRGERINLDNIERSVNDGVDRVKKKFR